MQKSLITPDSWPRAKTGQSSKNLKVGMSSMMNSPTGDKLWPKIAIDSGPETFATWLYWIYIERLVETGVRLVHGTVVHTRDVRIWILGFGFESISKNKSKSKSKSMNFFKSKIQSNPRTHLNPNPDPNPLKIESKSRSKSI